MLQNIHLTACGTTLRLLDEDWPDNAFERTTIKVSI
jgi:hypothetical protein